MAYKKIGGIYVNSEDVYKAYSADGKYYIQLSNGNVVGTSVQSEYTGICGALDKVGSNYINRTKIHKLYIAESKHYAELDNGNVIEISENDYNALITSGGGGEGGDITVDKLAELIKAEPNTDITVDVSDTEPKHLEIGVHAHIVEIVPATAAATSGTVTQEDMGKLTSSDNSIIMFGDEKFYLMDKRSGGTSYTYSHVGYDNNDMWTKSITITSTASGGTWELHKFTSNTYLFEIVGTHEDEEAWIKHGTLAAAELAVVGRAMERVEFKVDGQIYRFSDATDANFYTYICTYSPASGALQYKVFFRALYINKTTGVWDTWELAVN